MMAGRGRRLTENNKVGMSQAVTETVPVDVPTLIKKINEINASDINKSLLTDIEKMLKETFTSEDNIRLYLSKFHSQSLDDVEFGRKLILALKEVLHVEAGSTNVRNLLLSLIQNDFNEKDVNSKSNPKKFVNAVMLLGNVFNIIKVGGKPIRVLAPALFECLNLLLKGEDEELKTVVKQILINGPELLEENEHTKFMQNLRNTLITRNLNTSCKCWILLAIEFTSNGFQPLKGGANDFYVANLGDEYTKLKSFIPIVKDPTIHSPNSSESVKSWHSGSWRAVKSNSSPNVKSNHKKDLSEKFSNMNVASGRGKKVQSPPSKNQRKDPWKSSGGVRSSGHDDRFEKGENFYGVQKPRQPKPGSQKMTHGGLKSMVQLEEFENGFISEDLFGPVEGENWE